MYNMRYIADNVCTCICTCTCICIFLYCRRHKYLTDVLPQADDISLDLLNKLLNFNPNKRLTAENCLEHPYLSK